MEVLEAQLQICEVDRIISHFKLRFIAEKPPPTHVFYGRRACANRENVNYF